MNGAETAGYRPDPRAEAEAAGVGDVARLALAESPRAMTFNEVRQATRDRLGRPLYDPAQEWIRQALHQEYLMGRMDKLAFRENRRRLTPSGLRKLEDDKPAYRGHCEAAARDLATAAAERVTDRRPGVNHTRVEIDTSFESGLAVSWVGTRLGLIQYDGTDLMRSEADLLPDDHKAYGTLYLMVRRLELHLATDGHAEELLVFGYPKGDPEVGKRVYEGQETPSMHTEVRRDRVPLGVLRQLTDELRGHI